MDRIEKILLGTEDVINKGLPDIFLSVDLNQTFKEIKKEFYENTFDVRKQFDKERNTCRNFRIYGIVNSTVADCDNMTIKVYKDSGLTQFVTTINSSPLEFKKGNIFNKQMGKFYLELDNFLDREIYFFIATDNFSYTDQIYKQTLIYYDADSKFVPYGTQTIDITENGNTIELNNDFPFLYNKHWIKKDLDIVETKPTYVQFVATGQTVIEGNSATAVIELGRPSIFGNETVDLILNDGITTANATTDYSLLINSVPVSSTATTLFWTVGEQFKTLTFSAKSDFQVEFDEFVFYDLKNHYRVTPGTFNSDIFTIKDNTTRTYANFNLGTMWANRLAFSGRGYYPSWSPTTYQSGYYSSPSIFRNGHFNEGRNEEFWPVDYFYLDIFNQGVDTIIPANPTLGVSSDTPLKAGSSATFKVWPIYTSATFCEVKIYMPPSTYLPYYNYNGDVSINGLPIKKTTGPTYYGQSFKAFVDAINGGAYDYYLNEGIEKPFIVTNVDQTGYTVTIRSLSNGVDLDVSTNLYNSTTPGDVATATTITPFFYSEQLPLSFTLLGNSSGNNQAAYDFVFRKPGYSTLSIYNNTYPAAVTPVDNYLITSYRNALVPYDPVAGTCILPNVAADNTNNISTYSIPHSTTFPSGDGIYTYGICFLATKTTNSAVSNQTAYGDYITSSPYNYITGDKARFIANTFSPIPCTFTDLSSSSVAQKGVLVINSNYINPMSTTVQSIISQKRGFDFQNGTGQTQTYYKLYDNISYGANYAQYWYNAYFNVMWSSSTVSPNTGNVLQRLLDLGDTGHSPVVPVGPVTAVFPGPFINSNGEPIFTSMFNTRAIVLTAKVPGVPFSFPRIFDIEWEDNSNVFYTGDTTGSPTIYYIPVTPNEIAGVTVNPFKNRLGGFTLTAPL